MSGSLLHTVDAHTDFYRMLLCASHQDGQTGGSSVYLRPAGRPTYTSTFGTKMVQSGSIVGIALCAECTIFGTDGDVIARVEINGSSVFTVTKGITGTGKFTAVATQAAGIDVFSSGDLLEIGWQSAATNTCLPLVVVELEFDKGKVIKMGETGFERAALFQDESVVSGF